LLPKEKLQNYLAMVVSAKNFSSSLSPISSKCCNRGKTSQIGLEQQSVVQFSEECYLDYSMYVILERALPFVGDRIMFHNNNNVFK
jgi:hypothetical protein